MAESFDPKTRERVQKIPLLTVNAGPRDKENWEARLKEELTALIRYIQLNKETDMDWFTIEPVNGGQSWKGKCWYIHNLIKYDFDFQFDIPATYPAVAPEIELPELDGKTAKMYRGGKICLTIHFKPLWAKNRHAVGFKFRMANRVARQPTAHSTIPICQCILVYNRVIEHDVEPFEIHSPHFGIAHALCLGLAPWLAAEIPYMVDAGIITAKN